MDGNPSRRSVLKGIGTATVASGSVLSAARVSARDADHNRQRRQRLARQAHRVLQATGSPEKRAKFLGNHGFRTSFVHNKYSVPVGEQDGPETMDMRKKDLDIYISIEREDCSVNEYDCSEVLISMGFQYEFDYGDFGDHPWDVATIGYRQIAWDQVGNNAAATYARGPTTFFYRDAEIGPGFGFPVADADLGGGTSGWYSCGVWLKPDPKGSYPREVEGLFTHSKSGGSIDSISAGLPPSLSVSFKGGTSSWSTGEAPKTNDPLRVRESDIY